MAINRPNWMCDELNDPVRTRGPRGELWELLREWSYNLSFRTERLVRRVFTETTVFSATTLMLSGSTGYAATATARHAFETGDVPSTLAHISMTVGLACITGGMEYMTREADRRI